MADLTKRVFPALRLSQQGQILLSGEASGLATLLFHQTLLHQKIFQWPWLAQLAIYLFLLLFSFSLLVLGLSFLEREFSESNPLKLLLSLSPLCLAHALWLGHVYFLHDFRAELTWSILWGIIFILIIIKPISGTPRPLNKIVRNWSNLKPKTMAFLLGSGVLIVYNIISMGIITPSCPLTGDEPHYLLITTSLLQDQDTDLANNFQNKGYSTKSSCFEKGFKGCLQEKNRQS